MADQSLHVFSNASEDAYATVIYERNVYEDGSVSVSFVTSKSKVASLNAHNIPQLELLGVILGLHLCQVVSKVSGDHVLKKSVFWCESMHVLERVKNPTRKFKSFVANQIGEIHTVKEPTQWNLANGRINPADIGSQGMVTVVLSGCSKWWNGPEQQRFELAEKKN